MTDVRDILGSKELSEAVQAVRSLTNRYCSQRKPEGQPSFASIALGKTFRADKAAPIISAADPSYRGIVEVLFLGFCGWGDFAV
ncbi:hypothetical protein [Neorhizobium sp. S3-V5DH]|uniref:hypothetical protein n=1 Tax=Neorhizobium sp. S3-V5DH TaxID=2485166 RepID=UPI0010530FAF|nr:hypothetical protein [Neorhizobium sp. S3-V5DH]